MSHTGAAAPAWDLRASEKNCYKLRGNCSRTLKRAAGLALGCVKFRAVLGLGVFLDNHLILHMDLCLLSNDQNNWES